MQALQQKCRPKHQVLVLKCYPRTTKGAVDVKPNSSELSYLLFYASSRKTKIQKVGSFLEKKTASDVWRQRIGNVQVTLQILEALIEKSPKDLPLLAPSVLKILDLILQSKDITMVESSIPTFDAYCQNHDASSLFADQMYLRQYEAVVKQYAALASTVESQAKNPPTKSVALRWRNAGLEAIKSIASSDAMSSVQGRQVDVVVPIILENLWVPNNENFLEVLLKRANMEEKVSTEHILRRRNSNATTRTADVADEPNPIALSGSAGDVEKMEEQDTGVLATQCLKQIFVVPNRSQLGAATLALLKFIEERINQDETVVKTTSQGDRGWAIKIFELIARWTPMQERYVILVTAMDTMVRTQLKDDTLRQHLALTAMIGSLLRSDINLIGLSIMDVLLGLIQHMKKLVRMPGDPNMGANKEMDSPMAQRKELLGRILQTMADLATHVYYNEQIIDMVSALLLRLKPARGTSTSSSTPQLETDLDTSVDEPQVESLFSLTVAKITALKAIKLILRVASPHVNKGSNNCLSRYPVPVEKWEGTHWLLRDADGDVRMAYVDALLTWLDRETSKDDLIARDDFFIRAKMEPTTPDVRRARSTASYRERPARRHRSLFVHHLHIAIYDSALQFMDYDSDIVLLHALLTKLVIRLGVNAARFGLPMVFRLQEDIQDAETPQQKVRLGSLCHGYFWVLSEQFDFENVNIGKIIQNEIIRRRTKHLWVDGVSVPAPPLDIIGRPGNSYPKKKLSADEVEYEALLPFDNRLTLVDCICATYEEEKTSMPGSPRSPPLSPGLRQFPPHPMLGGSITASPPRDSDSKELPPAFKEAMLFDWSRDTALAAIQAANKAASLNGSRNGTSGTNRGRRGLSAPLTNGYSKADSPFGSTADLRPGSQPVTDGGLLAPISIKVRKTSMRSVINGRSDSTGGEFVNSIDRLKMILSGEIEPPPLTAGVGDMSSSDDSLVSYDPANSEVSFNHPLPNTAHSQVGFEGSPPMRSRSMSRERKLSDGASLGPLTSNPSSDAAAVADEQDDIPPVPPLPSGVASPPAHTATHDYALSPTSPTGQKQSKQRSPRSRGGSSSWSSLHSRDEPLPTMDMQSLLKGIDARAGEGTLGTLTRPPY